jgi:hypothetical protein
MGDKTDAGSDTIPALLMAIHLVVAFGVFQNLE